MMKDSPKRGRPPGTKSLVIFIQPDADAWLRAEAVRTDVAVGTLVELAIRRMMKGKSAPAPEPKAAGIVRTKPVRFLDKATGQKIKVVKL